MSSKAQHPGAILLERYLRPLKISPRQLAESLGVHPRRISELVKGKRPLTLDTAARLALFFDVPVKWWLDLQARYDADHVDQWEDLRRAVTPYKGLSEVLVTPRGVKRLGASRDAPARASTVTYSKEFLKRLQAQAALAEDEGPRVVRETTFADGTVALVGD